MKPGSRYRDGVDGGILDDARSRIVLIGGAMFLLFLLLTARLYYLQLYHGEDHRQRIASQSVRRIRVPGWRGSIYTRDRILLAGNRIARDLLFYPQEMRQGSRSRTIAHMLHQAHRIGRAVGRSDFPDGKAIERHLWTTPGMPLTVFRDLSDRECALALESSREMRGVELQNRAVRIYPQGDLAAHLIGYARDADAGTAEDREEFFYYRSDMVGKAGVEAAMDRLPDGGSDAGSGLGLRAFPGRQVVQVNNVGFVHKELLGKVEPVHGNDVTLTIDSRAQRLAEKLLAGHVGAMVVLDADTGDIICAASAPRYDLRQFVPRLAPEYYRELLNDPNHPLINRAISAIYPPGSTLKPLICLAFLKALIDPKQEIDCPGHTPIGNATIGCLAHPYGGKKIDMETALEKSCNGYMIHQALRAGFPALCDLLHSAGVGEKTGVELAENSGDFPSPVRKQKLYGTKWSDYDTALLSIGQGFISMTPLQLACYAAALANGGTLYRPHLVLQVSNVSGEAVMQRRVEERGRLDATPEALEVIRCGMRRVVHGGSGRYGAVAGLEIYGKTGTAEIGSRAARRNITHFICFVTAGNRRYAAAVTVEDGQSGGRTCAPIAAAFFDRYLEPEIPTGAYY